MQSLPNETSPDLTQVLLESYLYLISVLLNTLGSLYSMKLALILTKSYSSLISILSLSY